MIHCYMYVVDARKVLPHELMGVRGGLAAVPGSVRLVVPTRLASAFKPVLHVTVCWVKECGQRAC